MSSDAFAVVVTAFPMFFQETDDPASVAIALTLPADLNPGAAFPGLFSLALLIFIYFEHSSMEIETTSKPLVDPCSAPSSCSKPLSFIQPILGKGCASS
jgi:hypothetical protein